MEKRKALRVPLAMEVTYESGDDFLSAFLSDVSGGGVFIATPNPLKLGTLLSLCFHVPGFSESLLVTGTVVWIRDLDSSEKPGMGIQFNDMEADDRQRLSDFLARHNEG